MLFVSHNMSAIRNLCPRSVLLKAGQSEYQGITSNALKEYLGGYEPREMGDLSNIVERQGKGVVRYKEIWLEDASGFKCQSGISGEPLVVAMRYESQESQLLGTARASVNIGDALGNPMILFSSELEKKRMVSLPPEGEIRCIIPRLPLSQGAYKLSIFLEINHEIQDWIDPVRNFGGI